MRVSGSYPESLEHELPNESLEPGEQSDQCEA